MTPTPKRTNLILKRLKRTEPYLLQDWPLVEAWLRAHIELWLEPSNVKEAVPYVEEIHGRNTRSLL